MARTTRRFLSRLAWRPTPIALACLFAGGHAVAQPADALPAVTVRGQDAPPAQVSGFGNVPLARTPMQAQVWSQDQLKDRGATRLSDLVNQDASISDAYNSQGYWDFLSMRGYVLDNRFNYRRDGLPINAETSIPLDNKAAVEVLKGTSGIQAGTSAPGGLVNHVVKRPDGRVRSMELGWRGKGSLGFAADIGERFGHDDRFGLRVNAAYEHLDTPLHNDTGHRRLLAVAGDWRIAPGTLLEAEVESSRRSQPSQPGFSLLGDRLPSPVNPRINLNNQSWSQPVVMDGLTASVRLRQEITPDWSITAHYATQRLETDDRLAYPFGCSAADQYDRYCADGSFDYYEYVSDNERRRTHAFDLHADARLQWAGMTHQVTAGVLVSRFKSRLEDQIYSWAGTGTVDGNTQVPPSAGDPYPNTNRTERSTEFYVRDAIQIAPAWQAWVGLRHTRLQRESVLTSAGDDGFEPTDYRQSFTTPWFALSHEVAPGHVVYGSWGRGTESDVVPNRSYYTNRGQALPAMKSRQIELGWKARPSAAWSWDVAVFDIKRPVAGDLDGGCTGDDPCTRRFDGDAHHRGVEAGVNLRQGAWTVGASAMWLRARREGSADASLNGKRPVNVPEHTFKASAEYRVPTVDGLRLAAAMVHEGERMVLQDNSIHIPSWTRFDLGLAWQQRRGGTTLTWRAGIDNVTDKRAWRESPFQFGHVYLYPLAPRTFRVSLQADL
ncbi:MAG TPA: TonB-dependent siderophore receptor [Burkholderiaceae bacterium]|nr:TonB-dependent siderophore receptor [Burkholderiaceae bacterium]